MHQETGNTQSSTHTRPAECESRQAIQTRSNHSDRMVPSPRGFPSNLLPVARAPNGPVCHQVQQQTFTVSPVPDPQAWAVDALRLSWEDLDPYYAFPPAAILGKVVKLQDYPCNRIIKCPVRDACLHMGGILAEGSAISASLPTYSVFTSGLNFLGTWHIYLVALGKFSEFGAMTFQPIREVT